MVGITLYNAGGGIIGKNWRYQFWGITSICEIWGQVEGVIKHNIYVMVRITLYKSLGKSGDINFWVSHLFARYGALDL